MPTSITSNAHAGQVPTAPSDVSAVIDRLDAVASLIDVPCPHWLSGDDVDQGPSYCYECATKHVSAGKAESVDGGWQQDSDRCCHCEDCGRLLDYTLTDHGIREELSHFKQDRLQGPMSPERSCHLSRILEQHRDHPEVLCLLPKVERALAEHQGTRS